MHPRVGLHQVAFLDESTTAFLDHCRRIGVQHTTLVTPSLMRPGGLDEAKRALAAGGPQVETVNHQFAVYPDLDNDRGEAAEKLLQAIDIAAALGASSVYLQTGGRGCLTWEQAAERFAALIAPCKAAAAAQGVSAARRERLVLQCRHPHCPHARRHHNPRGTRRHRSLHRMARLLDGGWLEGASAASDSDDGSYSGQ